MERTGRTALMAALAGVTLVGSLLTACATKKATGTGTLGTATTGAGGAGTPGTGGAGDGGNQGGGGGGTGGGGTGGGGSGGGAGGGSGSGSPSPKPPPPSPAPGFTEDGPPTFILFLPDYSVKASANCHWIVDAAHHLSLYADVTISYDGLGQPSSVPYTVSNDKDNIGSSGAKPAHQVVGFSAILTNNVQTFSQSAWPGQTVTVTVKITPTDYDKDSANNVARVSIPVPAGEPQRDLLNQLPCTVV